MISGDGKKTSRSFFLGAALAILVACGGDAPPGEKAATPAGSEPVAAADGEAAEPTPKAVLETNRHDFGTVLAGTDVVHRFAVRNEGDAPLHLEITTGDPIRLASADRVIAPGEEGGVELVLDTTGRQGVGSSHATVETDDPDLPGSRLYLTGRIVRPVEIEPQRQIYFFSSRGKGGEAERTVVTYVAEPVRVTGVETDLEYLTVSVETVEPGRATRLAVALDRATPVGTHDGTVVVRTDSAALPTIEIPVKARVSDVVSVTPTAVDFGAVERSALEFPSVRRRDVGVRFHGEGSFRVLAASCDLPFVEVTVEPDGVDKFRIWLEVDPTTIPTGPFSGTVAIETDAGGFESLEVPFSGEVV